MQAIFNQVLTRLIEEGVLPETAQETSCPDDPLHIIPRLIDLGASESRLTKTLSELFHWPVYSAARHGEFEFADANKQWAYVAGVLFLACPFDRSMQAAALLPDKACAELRGIGMLPINATAEGGADCVEAESVIYKWLSEAVERRATDLHIIPLSPNYIRVRVRIDGQLRTLDEVPTQRGNTSYRFVSNMLLRMAGCQTGNFTKPLDGRFECELDEGDIEVRLAMRPVNVQNQPCQAFFLRLQGCGQTTTVQSLDALGLPTWSANFFAEVRRKNQGLLLMSGPTGSGKTSTLYANLARIVCDEPWRSVQTLEDPIEQTIEGVAQTQINVNAGIDFQDGLRALMRSDVDVILIGEVRDENTAQLAVRASLTGQLVFGTVHAKSALLAVERMLDLGVSGQSLASVLMAVVSQRLLRRVCEHCSRDIRFDESENYAAYAGLLADDCAVKLANDAESATCEHCEYGYCGRVVVMESVTIDRALAAIIAAGGTPAEMEAAARHQAHANFWAAARELIRKGVTTLAECERHLPPYEREAKPIVHSFTEEYHEQHTQHAHLRKVAETQQQRFLDP